MDKILLWTLRGQNSEVGDDREATAEIIADRETTAVAESVCHGAFSTAMTYHGGD